MAADELAKEVAREAWIGATKIYHTGISEQKVNELFEKWWRNNSARVIRKVGHGFYDSAHAPNLAPRVPKC